MNRLFLVRHGGSTGNESPAFYGYNDSAVCLTSYGVRQALSTGGMLAKVGGPLWLKPGNFDLEVYASEYYRAQQTARICLDQMGLLSVAPLIRPVLNERNYGVTYDPKMDQIAAFSGNDSESSVRARVRIQAFVREIEPMLERADVLAFSHMGILRALLANLRNLSDQEMMTIDVPNGGVFLFERTLGPAGASIYTQLPLPNPVLPRTAPSIEEPTVQPPPNIQ